MHTRRRIAELALPLWLRAVGRPVCFNRDEFKDFTALEIVAVQDFVKNGAWPYTNQPVSRNAGRRAGQLPLEDTGPWQDNAIRQWEDG